MVAVRHSVSIQRIIDPIWLSRLINEQRVELSGVFYGILDKISCMLEKDWQTR